MKLEEQQAEIKALRKRIVEAIETGKDPAPIQRELDELRTAIAKEGELAELNKIVALRQELRNKAESVKGKVKCQGESIDAFLASRDSVLETLTPILKQVAELARMTNQSWEVDPGSCYLFNDISQFQASVNGIPREMLPDGFNCPTLEMANGNELSLGKAKQAAVYLRSAVGILQSFKKGAMLPISQITDGSLLLDETKPERITELSCLVCNHEKAEEINKALQSGRPLRDLEAEYNVSRSTLSRHNSRCIKAEVV